MTERVVVAMSGGVDSTTAAALLLEEGYEVIGVSMKVWDGADPIAGRRTCCSFDHFRDAGRAAELLGIPHYVANLVEAFRTDVVDYFAAEYLRGRTPNPCIVCNSRIKFHALVSLAGRIGATRVATGHYAIVEHTPGERLLLRKGVDPLKEQSYFLFNLDAEQLACAIFPLGGYRKEEVRCMARQRGLHVAEKPESQEICFLPHNDYERFIRQHAGPNTFKEGDIVTAEGRAIGRHRGIPFYTVGQRKGLGVAVGEALYVTGIDPEANVIRVGRDKELWRRSLIVERLSWIIPPEGKEIHATVKIRYRHAGAAAIIVLMGEDRAQVIFEEPQRAITPGQAAVFYRGDYCLGGGWIVSAT